MVQVRNLHKFLRLNYYQEDRDIDEKKLNIEEDENYLSVCWGHNNKKDIEKIEDLMSLEYHSHNQKKTNFMWIEKIKQLCDWKKGECIYIESFHKFDYLITHKFSKTKKHYDGYFSWYQLYINPDGFLFRMSKNEVSSGDDDIPLFYWFYPNCYYNDYIAKKSFD